MFRLINTAFIREMTGYRKLYNISYKTEQLKDSIYINHNIAVGTFTGKNICFSNKSRDKDNTFGTLEEFMPLLEYILIPDDVKKVCNVITQPVYILGEINKVLKNYDYYVVKVKDSYYIKDIFDNIIETCKMNDLQEKIMELIQ